MNNLLFKFGYIEKKCSAVFISYFNFFFNKTFFAKSKDTIWNHFVTKYYCLDQSKYKNIFYIIIQNSLKIFIL